MSSDSDFLKLLPQELRTEIEKVAESSPSSLRVFAKLYQYLSNVADNNDASKRHKLPASSLPENNVKDSQIIFKLADISVLSPLRKKLTLALHISEQDKKPMLSLLRDGKSEVSVHNLQQNIGLATFLPVPERQNMVYLLIQYKKETSSVYLDPILIVLHKNALLLDFKKSGILPSEEDDFTKCIAYIRKQAILTGFRIYDPFSYQQHDTDDISAFHVECHRGTKEGTLYFLPDHILFGFKKPILIFASSDIESITYSSITRLTFNTTLITRDNEKFEFSMIDQTEYRKIDEYVKAKQVKDKSMSEELKAKSKSKNIQHSSNDTALETLREAEKQLDADINMNNMEMDSEDDEENDQNFEGESDLSDGSDQSEAEANALEEDVENNFRDDDNEKSDFAEHLPSTTELQLQDISIELEDNEQYEDDEEGSGVEY